MSWTRHCSEANPDSARFCSRCGQQTAPLLQPGAAPAAKSSNGDFWKLGVVVGVIVLGGIFGTLVAVSVFGGCGAHTAFPTSRAAQTKADRKLTVQQAFDAGF